MGAEKIIAFRRMYDRELEALDYILSGMLFERGYLMLRPGGLAYFPAPDQDGPAAGGRFRLMFTMRHTTTPRAYIGVCSSPETLRSLVEWLPRPGALRASTTYPWLTLIHLEQARRMAELAADPWQGLTAGAFRARYECGWPETEVEPPPPHPSRLPRADRAADPDGSPVAGVDRVDGVSPVRPKYRRGV